MSLELCILGSGSAGNSAAVRTSAGVVLIDAGLGPRTVAKRMCGTGVRVADVRAICLTHLDRDHFTPSWVRTIRENDIAVFCHRGRVRDLIRHTSAELEAHVVPFDVDAFEPVAGVRFSPVALAHDELGSHGFVIDRGGCRIGYATDLGRVPSYLVDRFCDLDILAIEANYDPQMQMNSARPWFLKQRIMGGRGHLSNAQALDAVRQILDRCCDGRLPSHIVLLHRSRECNCPHLLRSLFARDRRIEPRLTLAGQFDRTEWLSPTPRQAVVGEQLMLAY
jgi:phosphoribosyl 1,2-cyclic phosphodiesterase